MSRDVGGDVLRTRARACGPASGGGRAIARLAVTGVRAMSRSVVLATLLAAGVAVADVGWLAASARREGTAEYAVVGGPGSLGLAAQWWVPKASRAWVVEAGWSLPDRYLEARGEHLWLLFRSDWVGVSAAAGASLFAVPGPLDVGLGPHAALTLDVGRPVFSVQLGLQTEATFFARQPSVRFPQRLLAGFAGRIGPIAWALRGRVGADLEPQRAFVGRAEAVLVLGWVQTPEK